MKIYLGIPAYANQIHAGIVPGILQLYSDLKAHGDTLEFEYISTALVSFSRNYLMEQAKDSDFVLMWDADVQVITSFIYRWLELAKDAQVIGLLTRIKSRDGHEYACGNKVGVAGKYERMKVKPEKPVEVDFIAGGIHLLDNKWMRDNLVQPFYQITDLPGPSIIPEDWSLCDKVKAAGGKIMVDPLVEAVHWGQFGWV